MADDTSHNPFAGDAYGDDGGYGGGDAYGDSGDAYAGGDTYEASGPPVPPAAATGMAMDAATDHIASAYDETAADVEAARADTAGDKAPPPPPRWIDKFVDWLPVRYVASAAGLLLMVFPILDFMFQKNVTFAIAILLIYLMGSGALIVFIELPSCKLNRAIQLKVFFWVKLLSRTWGRCWFYFLLSMICFATFEAFGDATATGFAGVFLFITMVMMAVVSFSAATKYRRIYEFVAAGKEGEERDQQFAMKFDELSNGTEDIGSTEIITLAAQAGRELGNAQLHAIQSFLDESCHGRVLKKDFMEMFATYNVGQKFL